MAGSQIKAGFIGYPKATEGPKSSYIHEPGSNPVLSGIPLAIAGSAAATLTPLAAYLWRNAGLGALRDIDRLRDFEARYDPTVIPVGRQSGTHERPNNISSDSSASSNKSKGLHFSVADYHNAYKNGELTPLVVAKSLLALIATNPKHRVAFLDIVEKQVLTAAEASTERYRDGKPKGVFDGVPVAIKDEVDLHGHRTTLGSAKDFTHPGDITSWCVAKWEETGAIIIGKTNLHELGLDTTGNNCLSGTPRNPYNENYYPGGSSSGSAYATAVGLVPVTLGVDGGGSIRIPSSFCGLYGLKPSHGRVSRRPTVSQAVSTSCVGPMASNITDLEIAYKILAIPDPMHETSSLFPAPSLLSTPPTGNKLMGICRAWFEVADTQVLDACFAALSHYQSIGYEIVDIDIPYLHEGQLAHGMTILSESSTVLSNLSSFQAGNKILLAISKQTPSDDFLLAQRIRNLLMQHLAWLFAKHPGLLIVTPTTPLAGWHISGGASDLRYGISDANTSIQNMTYVWLANFTGLPALTIPVSRAEPVEGTGKVPIGLMAMAEWGAENDLFQWGKAGEAWTKEEELMPIPDNWVNTMALAKNHHDVLGVSTNHGREIN